MKCIFILSGEHPTLPLGELCCVGHLLEARQQVAVVECPDPSAVRRLSLTHAVAEYLGECEPTTETIEEMLDALAIEAPGRFAVRVKKCHGAETDAPPNELEHLIGYRIKGDVSLSNPEVEYRAVLSGDRCYFGRLLAVIDRGAYDLRRPGSRPFFHPGVMVPRTARALVNLARVQPGDRLYDPFCGTGGILVEASLLSADAIGTDADPAMASGSRFNVPQAEIAVADAVRAPFADSSMDAVVTDLPYGQSSWIQARGLESLYEGALAEIGRVLRPGRRAVVVTHRDIRMVERRPLELVEFYEQRVHKSLTRRIMVLRR